MTIAYALMSSSPYHTQALWLLFITSNTLPPLSAKLASDLSMATRVCGAPHLSLWQDLKLQHCIQALWSMVFTRHSLACSSALISTVDLSSDVYDFFLGNQIWNHDALSPPPFQQLFLCRSSLLLR
ncbi:unnamed protein product [Brassica oleracea var. botrytis]|uniref:Uncharacterized protein n=2 Tax=Brassica TaxID=3705 RepID=A0A0D2ZTZ2_BRAOL|nr:unnamed protein product [Brassica napus]